MMIFKEKVIETNETVYVVEVKVKPKHRDISRLVAKAVLIKKSRNIIPENALK